MKKLLAVLLAVITVFAMSACGDKYSSLKIGNIVGFGQNILNRCTFEGKLDEVDDLEYSALKQLKIPSEKINMIDGKPEMYRALGQPEEVLIIGANDAAAAKDILNGPINDWVNYLLESYPNYGADQMPKLESCVKMTAGRYAFLIISNDNKSAKSVLTDLLDTSMKIHE